MDSEQFRFEVVRIKVDGHMYRHMCYKEINRRDVILFGGFTIFEFAITFLSLEGTSFRGYLLRKQSILNSKRSEIDQKSLPLKTICFACTIRGDH